jgi:hypothetical protein
MFPRISPSPLMLVGIALLMAGSAAGQLVSKSPFLPPQAASAGPSASAPLQFLGYLDTRDGRMFRIHDPAKKTSTWAKLNEKQPDFDVVVKQHDDSQNTLVIEHQGKTLTLAQRQAKIVSSGSAAQAIPPPTIPVASNVPTAVTQAVVLNPTPADEQRRLEAVAAEVARRRALREQATQQINQGQAPQVPVPATQPGQPQQSSRGGPMTNPGVNPPNRQR